MLLIAGCQDDACPAPGKKCGGRYRHRFVAHMVDRLANIASHQNLSHYALTLLLVFLTALKIFGDAFGPFPPR